MTSQGSAHGRFQRAIERRNVFQAEMAARELERRWIARLATEGRDVRVVDPQLAAAALSSLRGLRRERAEKTLLGLL